ncbi:MAG: nucleotidyltransferase domain-containing protein [Anaerolineae bacterium]|nr:nucleotidyltransferase domain-containing protein [Anaerolineae bacterium]
MIQATPSSAYQKDLQQAIQILKNAGCSAIYLFGSHAIGKAHEQSDIDLAIQGCPQGQFFSIVGKLYMELDTRVDLVDLDNESDPFARRLTVSGELVPVA